MNVFLLSAKIPHCDVTQRLSSTVSIEAG